MIEDILDKYEARFERELSLNQTQTAYARLLLSDFLDALTPKGDKGLLTDEGIMEATGAPVVLSGHRRLCQKQRDFTSRLKDEEQQLAIEIAGQQGYEAGLEKVRQERDRPELREKIARIINLDNEETWVDLNENQRVYLLFRADQILALFDEEARAK